MMNKRIFFSLFKFLGLLTRVRSGQTRHFFVVFYCVFGGEKEG